MSTLNEKMTALADEVRELSGTTGTKSIDAMTTDIQDANTEVAEQADLIAQIINAVNNLPDAGSGGGSSGGGEPTGVCPELTISGDAGFILGYDGMRLAKIVYYQNNELKTETIINESSEDIGLERDIISDPYIINNVDVNSIVAIEVYDNNGVIGVCVDLMNSSDNIEILFQNSRATQTNYCGFVVLKVTNTNPAVVSFTLA